MVNITKAEIAKENHLEIFKKSRGAFDMPKIAEKYDIKAIQKLHKATFKIVDVLIEKLKDGFQITDAFGAFSLFSPVKDISANWKQAALEYKELSPSESSQLFDEVGQEILRLTGVKSNDIGERGIDHLMFVLTLVGDLYDLIADKLKDGYQAEDLDELPEFTNILIQILGKIDEASLDAKDLKPVEYVEMGRYLTLRVHGALAS